MRQRLITAVVLLCATFVSVIPSADAARQSKPKLPVARPDSSVTPRDVRDGRTVAPRAEAVAAVERVARNVPELSVSWSPRYGTVAMLASGTGRLAQPVRGGAEAVARGWLAAHRDLFALPNDAQLTLTRDAALPGTGLRALVFRQTFDGLASFAGGVIGVNVAADGGVVTVWADAAPGGRFDRTPRVSSAQATAIAARALRAGTRGESVARLGVFPTAHGPRLAWRVFFTKGVDEAYTAAVDARDGSVLYIHDRVLRASGRVFRNHPGAARGGTQETVSFDGDPAASPNGWVGPAPFTTAGNNAVAFNDFLGVDRTPPNRAPISPTGNFDYPYEAAWEKDCTPVAGEGGLGTVENPSYLRDVDVSTTNLFYFANLFHDLTYKLGFTEAMGNFQRDNFGKGGRGGDAIEVASMSGVATGSVDNAYFITSPDGGEPVSGEGELNVGSRVAMFLFRPAGAFLAPCADSSLDAQIVWHELTHGLTTRVVGGPDDSDSLHSAQSAAMGEGWSDWFALHLLHQLGLEDTTAFGAYVTGNRDTGIRNFNVAASPLTLGDFGYGFGGPEVHDDAEIWSAALWDMRSALVRRHGAVAGAARAGHLVFDALVLVGLPSPTFLQQRDGILQADKARYGGGDADLIWQAFAKRGMGVSAATTGLHDVEPRPGFDVPGTRTAIRGTVRDADTGAGLRGVDVAVGFGEGGPTPAAVTDDAGGFSIAAAPGRYRLTYRGSGYGLRHVEVEVGVGDANADVALSKNLASASYGAKVIGGATPAAAGISLLDDDDTTGPLVVVGQPVTVRLAGADAVDVTAVQAALRFNGLGVPPPLGFAIELSADGERWETVHTRTVLRRKPLPVVQDVAIAHAALASPRKAKFARLTATSSIAPAAEGDETLASVTELQVFGAAPTLAPVAIKSTPVMERASIRDPLALGVVTPAAFETTCGAPPDALQGHDAWVTDLAGAGDGSHRIRLDARGADADLDVNFYDESCVFISSLLSPGNNEQGPIPPGAAWAVTFLFSGPSPLGFDVHVASTIKPVLLGAATPASAPGGRLVRTGGTGEALRLAALALGLVVGLRLLRTRTRPT